MLLSVPHLPNLATSVNARVTSKMFQTRSSTKAHLSFEKVFCKQLHSMECISWKCQPGNRPKYCKVVKRNNRETWLGIHRKNRTYLKCKKCGTLILDSPKVKKDHCLVHLKKEKEFSDMYTCLVCGRKFHSFGAVNSHLGLVEKLSHFSVGIHYLDESEKYNGFVEKLLVDCFTNAKSIVKQMSYKRQRGRVQCKKCLAIVTDEPCFKRTHTFPHVQNETEYKWLFRCLICPKRNFIFESMYDSSLRKHFQAVHEKIKPKCGENYEERLEESKHAIDEMVGSCFPPLKKKISRSNSKVKRRSKSKVKRRISKEAIKERNAECEKRSVPRSRRSLKCLKCGVCVSHLANRKQHSIVHLKQANKIDWFYKCLLCQRKKYTTTTHSCILNHLSKNHSKIYQECTVGVDYLCQKEKYLNLIKAEIEKCFNYVIEFKKPLTQKNFSRKLKFTAVCKICNKIVCSNKSALTRHAAVHLKSETTITNLFLCIICRRKRLYCGRCFDDIRIHIQNTHNVRKPILNTHYLDHTNKYKAKLKVLYKKCFPDYAFLMM